MLNIFSHLNSLVNLFLPPVCLMCGAQTKTAANICAPCASDLPYITHACKVCALTLSLDALICGACLRKKPLFTRTIALFHYDTPIPHFIAQLKFQHKFAYAKLFGELLSAKIARIYQPTNLPDVIIPIPLHPTRLKSRGFNQSLEIARPLIKQFKMPIFKNALIRSKFTPAQSGLKAAERHKNMRDAFIATRDLTGLSIALLDDVMTTGATLNAACIALHKAGAKNIHIWCCARRDITTKPG